MSFNRLVIDNRIRFRAITTWNTLAYQTMVNIKRYNSKDKKINIDSAKWHAGDHSIEKPMDYSEMESIIAGTFESFHKYSITGNYEKNIKKTRYMFERNGYKNAKNICTAI